MSSSESKREKKHLISGSFVGLSLLMFLSLTGFKLVYGADYPTKPIQIICPYQPGGSTDVTSRFLTKGLLSVLGQPVVIETKPGAGTAIGIVSVLASPPDGYTVLCAEQSLLTLPLTLKDAKFGLSDFTPINVASSATMAVIVKKDAPWKTLVDLVAEAKKNPGKLTYSSAGPGSTARFTGELFQTITGTTLTQIPMNGAAPAIAAVLGGHVDMSFMGSQVIKSHVQAGSLRVLAMLKPKRIKEFSDIPTAAEMGYPKLTNTLWIAYFVPAKTPKTVVKKLGDSFHEVLKGREVIEMVENSGLMVENLNQEDAAKFLGEEQKKWLEVAKTMNIAPK